MLLQTLRSTPGRGGFPQDEKPLLSVQDAGKPFFRRSEPFPFKRWPCTMESREYKRAVIPRENGHAMAPSQRPD